ncbi:CRISPR-associated protein Cas4 [Bacillaceae bacterium ZC4]|jgi:CRISPR-associated exonuclease Cas4|uniref:CRISPR-associated protein Cas4 n=1 Tax=Aeribacillus TaxID=1055323 RepID=UPI000E3B533F|nr:MULTISPECIES: CRISPR-associated protein Cas4 [Aeribacillus]AXI38347.1 CRISPR-associated protein Cas4 [Bacillaceae bacterium ZC4]REJ23036.1 MAG: CRISPR-associated protein Cas4 [Bacillaceae bacterium]MED1439702.1 CRISPR-associated protein Cas4 [Aeribacillus composti]RZI50160.1 CRISPR-associated protein Cas4 [Aeribacillus pallidus]TVZ77660.1 CRISPR-associated Cas4 family exonuclease [Aeribacillus composti]
MVNNEEEIYLMLSGIQHFQFCRRQWALIHIEQQWEENVRTIEGQYLHRKADKPFIREKRGNKLIVRAMPVKSNELKITGVCDVVEFVKDNNGVEIVGAEGKYVAYPIEYKRGKPKINDSDILQLTAQVMCLEEMLLCKINTGYMFYNEIKRRVEIPITLENKNKVRSIVLEMHDHYKRKYTPKVKTGSFCKNCSLQNICLPNLMNKRTVKSYIEGKIKE